MRVTRHEQSCLLMEDHDARVVIDPGTLTFQRLSVDDLGPLDAVLLTHRHADHLDADAVAALAARGATVVGNADVAVCLEGVVDVEVVRDGEQRDVAGFRVLARDLPHVEMVDGSPGPQNTGFLVDDRLFHPGDGMGLQGLVVDTLAVPIAGPSISNRDAYRFVQQTAARMALPIHYDYFLADPELFAKHCDIAEVVVLGLGESAEL